MCFTVTDFEIHFLFLPLFQVAKAFDPILIVCAIGNIKSNSLNHEGLFIRLDGFNFPSMLSAIAPTEKSATMPAKNTANNLIITTLIVRKCFSVRDTIDKLEIEAFIRVCQALEADP